VGQKPELDVCGALLKSNNLESFISNQRFTSRHSISYLDSPMAAIIQLKLL
jgi:hypothetical protein